MKQNQIKKGMIVVVKEGEAWGNKPNTITKVLAKPGRVCDQVAKHINRFYSKHAEQEILCKAPKNSKLPQTCNNTKCFVELRSDLRPAEDWEKELFKRNKYEPTQVPENVSFEEIN